jgi:hypothetical protein
MAFIDNQIVAGIRQARTSWSARDGIIPDDLVERAGLEPERPLDVAAVHHELTVARRQTNQLIAATRAPSSTASPP